MYQALYRKYRPLLFENVVGQKTIVQVLKNSITNNQVGHAYMLFGPRGTGKTSLAKIFSRNINCLNSKVGEACGKCENCIDSFSSNCIDIIEIDAASNNGVEEIRNLKSKINLVPTKLNYKVYIIDEVHMLSIGAFNALLKTLEEPPQHVVFVLATTDPQKVPETIKSRCQCFNFQRISNKDIVDKLEEISDLEKMVVERRVLENIAIASAGGLRDSIGMLDLLSTACNNNITYADYISLNNLVDDIELEQMIEEILTGDITKLLKHINTLNENGKNLIQICELLLNKCRVKTIDYYMESNTKNIATIENLLFLLNERMFDIKRASNPKIYMEIILLKYINDNISQNQKNTIQEKMVDPKMDKLNQENVSLLEKGKDVIKNEENEIDIEKKEKQPSITEKHDIIDSNFIKEYNKIMKIRAHNVLSIADKSVLNQIKKKMATLNDHLFDQTIGYLICNIMDGSIRAASSEGVIIGYEYSSMVDEGISNIDKLHKLLKDKLELNLKIALITDKEWENLRLEYMSSLKSGEVFKYIEEPSIPKKVKKQKKNELLSNAENLFGNLVEEE